MLPNFVIIGAQKSASTFLQACLNDHPDIYLPNGETAFFESPDYEKNTILDLKRIFEQRNEKCLGIKRPNYLGKPEVPGRIQNVLPNAKLLAVLRNPIDRAVSAYYHLINYGFLPPLDIETGMRNILDNSLFVEKYKRSTEVIEFGYYWKYLKKYQHFIESDRLIVFLHEDIISNSLEQIQKAYKFLDVSSDYIPDSLGSRPQEVIYNLTRLKFLILRNNYIYNYNNDNTRLFNRKCRYYEKILSGIITEVDRKILSRILHNSRPVISLELKQVLYQKYESDINALENFMQRDLSDWRTDKI